MPPVYGGSEGILKSVHKFMSTNGLPDALKNILNLIDVACTNCKVYRSVVNF